MRKKFIIQFSEENDGFVTLYNTLVLGQDIHSLGNYTYVINEFQKDELDKAQIPYKIIGDI